MCYLIQRHVFTHFSNNQKLLILFNKIDVIGGKSLVKGTLMKIWKSTPKKYYTEGFALWYSLLSEIYAPEAYEMFVYKYTETIEYLKN